MTDKEEKRLDQLMAASYALTKPERKRLKVLLAKSKAERTLQYESKPIGDFVAAWIDRR